MTQSLTPNEPDYKQVAQKLGARHLFGRWGLSLGSKMSRRPHLVPLDGWITDPKEVERIIRQNGLEL